MAHPLLERLEAAAFPPEDREAVATLASRLTALLIRQAGGEEVEEELLHVRAQAANLAAASSQALATEFRLWATDLVSGLIAKAL